MLAQGKKLEEESQMKSIHFRTGNAEELPYESKLLIWWLWLIARREEQIKEVAVKYVCRLHM